MKNFKNDEKGMRFSILTTASMNIYTPKYGLVKGGGWEMKRDEEGKTSL